MAKLITSNLKVIKLCFGDFSRLLCIYIALQQFGLIVLKVTTISEYTLEMKMYVCYSFW